MKLSKKQLTTQWLHSWPIEDWGACIHCGLPLHQEDSSFVCPHHHRFDGAKQGYYYLSKTKLSPTKYDKELFNARRHIIQNTALYDALHRQFDTIISTQLTKAPTLVIDAGSGEGSHLMRMRQYLPKSTAFIGADLAKDGIQLATEYNGAIFSIIADLANLPIQDETAEIIFSILSPANYQEFKRILKPHGLVIKVIPNADYLVEVREALAQYHLVEPTVYDNSKVLEVFTHHFPDCHRYLIHDKVHLSYQDKQALLKMTPLAWQLSEEQKEQLVQSLSNQITLDCTVLVGHKLD